MAEASWRVSIRRFALCGVLPSVITGSFLLEFMKALAPSLGLWTVPVSFLAMGVVSGLMGVGIDWLIRRWRPTDAEPGAAADGGA